MKKNAVTGKEIGIGICAVSPLCSIVGALLAVLHGATCYVFSGEKTVKLVDQEQVASYISMQSAVQRFNVYDYDGAGRIFQQMTTPHTVVGRHVKDALALLCEAYSSWDAFRYRDGPITKVMKRILELLRPCAKERSELTDMVDGLERNYRFLENLVNETSNLKMTPKGDFMGQSPRVVADIVCNGKRRVELGQNNDAIVRFYRALEAITQHRLIRKYRINPSDFADSMGKLNEKDRASVLKALGYPEEIESAAIPEHTAGLAHNIKVLSDLKDDYSEPLQLPAVKNLMSARDRNIMVHQYESTQDDVAAAFEAGVEEILTRLLLLDGLDFQSLVKEATHIHLHSETLVSIIFT